MKIKVLGPGCAKCNKTVKLVQEVIQETGVEVSVEKVSDMMQIASYGVFGTPSVIVDGEVKCIGKIPRKEDIKAWITE